jgi:hypothetical protein
MDYIALMEKARRTNEQRDLSEAFNDWVPVSEATPLAQVLCAMEAIKAGIKLNEMEFIAEAQAILEVLAVQLQEATNGHA